MASLYIPLRVHTAYSLLEGAIKIKDLVKLCKQNKMPACAITDRNNLFGSMEFSMEMSAAGIQPIIGGQFSFAPMFETRSQLRKKETDELMLYAMTEEGYQNLLALASETYLTPEGGEGPLLSYEKLANHSRGIVALTGGIYGAIGKAILSSRMDDAATATDRLMDIFSGDLAMEIMRHGMPEEAQTEAKFIEMALAKNIPLVATNDVYFHGGREMYEAHDALLCIAGGRYINETERRRLTPEHRFKTPDEMRLLFADIPEAIENTVTIAKRCAVMSPYRKPMLPRFRMTDEQGNELSEAEALRERSKAGLQYRLEELVFTAGMTDEEKAAVAKPYWERLDFELNVIIQMQFPGYFLIVSDFITWSKEHGLPVGPGRGSGAASVVAWSLLITDLDPLKCGLVFERFLNPERVSMPDFDIDFCQDRRDEVIRYVQQKYGVDKVAQIITFGKLQARAVLRDVGRVLQIPYGQVDRITKLVPNNPAAPVTLEEAIKMEPALRKHMEDDESVKKMIEIALKLEGLYRHSSTHAAGIVIADRPLSELVPMYRDPKSDIPVVQYSMKYAEAAGLVKFDFLGLKTLTVLQMAVNLLKERDIDIDLLKIPLDDKKTYKILSNGDAIGIFQFESAGMRDSLKKLKPDCLEDLVALGALYRPGPMDNIPSYINRKHGREKADYLHPMLEPVLKETHGVIIYQEQVQQIAQIMAGYTLGGADLLRRAMGKKIKEEMDAQRERFVSGAKEKEVDIAQANYIFDLVAKFAGYGFNKAHAAAYALIGYQTAYLKANYPVEFFAASMTYEKHSTDKLAIFKEDAGKAGVKVRPPDINLSDVNFAVEGNDVRYALSAIKNVGEQSMSDMVSERKENGPFASLFDFCRRVDPRVINRRQLENLIKAGVFDSIHRNRRQLFESIDLFTGYSQAIHDERASNQISLFGEASQSCPEPALPKLEDWAPFERMQYEFDAIGFHLSGHPLEAYAAPLKRLRAAPAAGLAERLSATYAPVFLGGIVTGRKFKVSDRGRFAFVQLSDPSGIFEVSIFNEDLLSSARDLLEPGTLLFIKADGKLDDSGMRLIATEITPLDQMASTTSAQSLNIELETKDALPQIKNLLGEPGASGLQVFLKTPIAAIGTPTFALTGRYHVPTEAIVKLKHLAGIRHVEEV
ncbi:MAG: DNA polymerase III subunit alpha [Rickettsiales bacterium]